MNNAERIKNDVDCSIISSNPSETIGNYWDKYNRINQKIIALEVQIKILTECAERYQTDSLESALHMASYNLSLRKKEISPVIDIISRSISQLCSDVDGTIVYERLFLGHNIYEIAHDHEISENSVNRNLNAFLKAPVPSEVLDEILNK